MAVYYWQELSVKRNIFWCLRAPVNYKWHNTIWVAKVHGKLCSSDEKNITSEQSELIFIAISGHPETTVALKIIEFRPSFERGGKLWPCDRCLSFNRRLDKNASTWSRNRCELPFHLHCTAKLSSLELIFLFGPKVDASSSSWLALKFCHFPAHGKISMGDKNSD